MLCYSTLFFWLFIPIDTGNDSLLHFKQTEAVCVVNVNDLSTRVSSPSSSFLSLVRSPWARRALITPAYASSSETQDKRERRRNAALDLHAELQRVSPSLRRIRLHSSLLRSSSVGQTTGMLPANGFSCWIINCTHTHTHTINQHSTRALWVYWRRKHEIQP